MFARHGSGSFAVLQGFASQVHPVFMLPALAASAFGAVLAGRLAPAPLAAHLFAVFAALYTAHVMDGYVDYHVRGEDDDHPLTVAGCRAALLGAGVLFVVAVAALWALVGVGAALLALPGWVIGYLHAPRLDANPVTATVGYPTGIALALLGGYYAQVGHLAVRPVSLAAVFLVVLSGVKVVDDSTDVRYDRSIDKRTVAVVLGTARARRLAHALLFAGGALVVALAVTGTLPAFSVVGVAAFGGVAFVSRRADPELATMLLVRGAYVLLAALVAAVWFRPLAGVSLPDVGVFGRYTYLVTEVGFGALALALLVRAGALSRAARTTAVLYPLAFVWDWYTLKVGVFSIPLRTGVELLGIPLEEHVFMLVVPGVVVGVHELLHGRPDAREG